MTDYKDNISPEEKLLRFIRKPKSHERRRQGNVEDEKRDIKELNKKKHISLKSKKSKNISYLNSDDIISLSLLNKIFLVLSSIALILLLVSFFSESKPMPQFEYSSLKDAEPVVLSLDSKDSFAKKYSSSAFQKDIFGKITPDVKESKGSAVPEVDPNEFIRDLTLIGIIAEEDPGNVQAVIEDKKSGKTYFLRNGNLIGQLKVIDIKDGEGKVILDYKGYRLELYL